MFNKNKINLSQNPIESTQSSIIREFNNIESALIKLNLMKSLHTKISLEAITSKKRSQSAQIAQKISTLIKILESNDITASNQLLELIRTRLSHNIKIYEGDIQAELVSLVIDSVFPINSNIYGLKTDTGEINKGVGLNSIEKPLFNIERFNILMSILKQLGNAELDPQGKWELQNVIHIRGESDTKTWREYSYTLVELVDKDIIILESFLDDNIGFIIDSSRFHPVNKHDYIMSLSKSELKQLDHVYEYTHNKGYKFNILEIIYSIINQEKSENDSEHKNPITPKANTNEVIDTTLRWDNIINYIRTYGKRPSAVSNNPLIKSYGQLIHRYVSTGYKLGLTEIKEIEFKEALNIPEEIDTLRWDNIIDYIKAHGERHPSHSNHPLLKSHAQTLSKYISTGTKKGMLENQEKELFVKLKMVDDINKLRWDNLIEYIKAHGKTPSRNSNNKFLKSLNVLLLSYTSNDSNKGITEYQEKELNKILDTIDSIDTLRWDNIIDYIRTYGKRPPQKSKLASPLVKHLGFILNSFNSKGMKKGLTKRQESDLNELLLMFDTIDTLRWDNIIDYIIEHKKPPSTVSKNPYIKSLGVATRGYISRGLNRGMTEKQEKRLNDLGIISKKGNS